MFIFKPLFAIALLASLLEEKISFNDKKSKILIPFSRSLFLICTSGKSNRIPLASKVSLEFFSAFFESVSGYTTTGATILDDIGGSLDYGLMYWRSLTQYMGGMGIIVFTIAILPLLGVGGVQLFKAEVPGPVADKIKPRVKETAKILWMVYVGFTILQTMLLGFAGMPWFDSVCHAFTTMPTGGFSTQNASIALSLIHI